MEPVQHAVKSLLLGAFFLTLVGVLFTVDNLSRQIDTQTNKIQKGQEKMATGLSYAPSADGGVNYFNGDAPITREVYAALNKSQGQTSNTVSNGVSAFPLKQASASVVSYSPDQYSTGINDAATRILNGTGVGNDTLDTYSDPYKQYGGKAAYDSLVNGFGTQKQNIYGSANDAATNLQGGLGQSVLDTIRNFSRAQEGIDRKGVQNESSRIQAGSDILSMIGRGVRSGGVQLSQKNAGSSSAAQAIANAYAQLGQRQASQVGNQYAQKADQIALEQRYQNEDMQAAPDKFKIQIEQNANQIATAARDQFAQLDAAMANASLPDRIAIEQEKESVRQQALAKLTQFDTQLRQGVGNIRAADRGTNIGRANTQLTAGQADPNLFNYTTETPAQFQGTGPFASELPIFTFNNRNKQQLA